MFLKAGTKVKVEHSRKGTFEAEILKTFDSNVTEWVSIKVLTRGGRLAEVGDDVTFRASFAKITEIK